MKITIRKIGNSEGVIIPKDVLDRMGVKAGDELILKEENGEIKLVPQNADLAEQLKAAQREAQENKAPDGPKKKAPDRGDR